jgi:hypothetical protein
MFRACPACGGTAAKQKRFLLISVVFRSAVLHWFDTKRKPKMKPLVVIGLILVVLGVVALAVPSFTFFTTEHVANLGFFTIDVSRPHTIVFNLVVGGIALAAGIVLVLVGLRSGSA